MVMVDYPFICLQQSYGQFQHIKFDTLNLDELVKPESDSTPQHRWISNLIVFNWRLSLWKILYIKQYWGSTSTLESKTWSVLGIQGRQLLTIISFPPTVQLQNSDQWVAMLEVKSPINCLSFWCVNSTWTIPIVLLWAWFKGRGW